MTAPTHIPIAGLRVPVGLVPRIVAAFRGTYPELTTGLDDDASVRAVLRHWVSTTLSSYEAHLVELTVDDALDEVRQDYANRARAARERAELDAETILEAPPTPPV